MTSPVIDILLATYNGESYVVEQIESLLAQTYESWHLYIRDDGSNDSTRAVLEAYQARYAERITLLPLEENLGVIGNFSALLAASKAPYAMFCDQDDVWYPQKLAHSLEVMQKLESQYGSATPCLVHSDAQVVDAGLGALAASFHQAQKLSPSTHGLSRQLVQNAMLGCTVMLNTALRDVALPIPAEARMHDMWVALLAYAAGQVVYLDQPLMDYRQHDKNAVGLQRRATKQMKAKVNALMCANIAQAQALEGRLEANQLAIPEPVHALATLAKQPYLGRACTLLRHGLLRYPLYQNLSVLLYL